MPDYAVSIVDAFTTKRFTGNPCGVVARADGLDESQMQQIARELNLSETAFVLPSTVADIRVRFFTPARELPLAGHPTIAVMHTLVEEGRIVVNEDGTRIVQELRVGPLPVDLARGDDGSVRVTMTQARPEFLQRLDRDVIADALGIDVYDILPGANPQVVSTGTPQAMIPVRSIDVLKRLRPDFQRLSELEAEGDYYGSHIFALEAFDAAHRTHARHFAGSSGIPEDPVTGSATGGMGAYLWRHGLLREPRFFAEQGHIIGRPGIIEVEVEADGDQPTGIRISGSAVTVIKGTIMVQASGGTTMPGLC